MLSSRSLVLPTDLDSGTVDMMNIRTPGKAFHKTPGKTIARNRATLQENAAYYGGAMTVNRKGKAVAHTPSRPAISRECSSRLPGMLLITF